jgi:prevent-host-death family protein
MPKQVPASDAKNNFGGLLESVASLGRVDIVKHGRLVAIVLSPRELEALSNAAASPDSSRPANKHMIPPHLARNARMLRPPLDFNED